jgi:hypothetical protein
MTKAMLTIVLAVREELTMFRDKVNPLRRNRAVTLIEAVLYISIALALIVGGLVFYQQASTAAKTSATVRQLSAIIAEARVLIKGQPVSVNPALITPLLISAGAVPSDMVNSGTSQPNPPLGGLSNPFGGTTELYHFYIEPWGQVISIDLTNVPQAVCARLLTASSGSDAVYEGSDNGGTTLVSSGYIFGGAGAAVAGGGAVAQTHIMNPTQAGWMCKYGGLNYPNKTTQPTSAPISGNVDVTMAFIVER